MNNDVFICVKALLDDEAGRWNRERDLFRNAIATLRTACDEIAMIQEDDRGNGLALARRIAREACRDTEEV
jgi:hypothetical protein